MARTNSPKTAIPSTHTLVPTHAAQAFDAVEDEIRAIPADELLLINLDILRAAGRGALAAERITPLLPALSRLDGLDFPRVERLGTYALALHYAHDLVTEGGTGTSEPVLAALLEEAVPLREGMLRSAELLAYYGIFLDTRVAAIRSGRGHAEIAAGLVALGRLFGDAWTEVSGKVPVTRMMVDRAPVLGAQLHKALAKRELEESPLVLPQSRRFLEAQAFTLFARAHAEAYRGVAYLRWYEGDAHLFVPSLYPHRPRRSSAAIVERSNPDVDEASTGSALALAPVATPIEVLEPAANT